MTAMDGSLESAVAPGTSTLARVPTMRRKSSASNLLTNINKSSTSPASPPIRDPAPALPDWDKESVFSDASGGAGTIASSAGLLSGAPVPPTPALGPGIGVESLQHIIHRRLQVFTMLKSCHEGNDFWFNTIKLTRQDLEKVLNNQNKRKRTYRFTLLSMSLSALFEVQTTQITNPPTPSDFLRSLLGTLSEFDQFIGSGAEKAGVSMMMGLVDSETRGKMRNLFRGGRVPRRAGTTGVDLAPSNDSGSEHSYLLFPSLPFLLDYFQVLPTLCDIFIALYHKLAHLLGSNPNATGATPFTFLPHPSPPPDASSGPSYTSAPGICGIVGGIPGSDLWSLLNAGPGRDFGTGVGVGAGHVGVGAAGHHLEPVMQWSSAQMDMVMKIDAKVKKIMSILLEELNTIARDAIRDELSSLDPLLRNLALSPPSGGSKFEPGSRPGTWKVLELHTNKANASTSTLQPLPNVHILAQGAIRGSSAYATRQPRQAVAALYALPAAGLPVRTHRMSWYGKPKSEFAAHEISLGFELIAAHLKNNPPRVKGLPIVIVVAGGAISTLLFRNRKTTKDVDFWAPDRETNYIVSEAGRAVAKRLDYDPYWLNSNMSVFIDTANTHHNFYENAISQGVILYSSDQIMVYAADWRYQLVQKLIRVEMLSKGPMRDTQLSDIVCLAKVIMEREGVEGIGKATVRGWYKYTKNIRDGTFDEVNEAFQDLFGVLAFI